MTHARFARCCLRRAAVELGDPMGTVDPAGASAKSGRRMRSVVKLDPQAQRLESAVTAVGGAQEADAHSSWAGPHSSWAGPRVATAASMWVSHPHFEEWGESASSAGRFHADPSSEGGSGSPLNRRDSPSCGDALLRPFQF